MQSWDESMSHARSACEAWRKESVLSRGRAEVALREREEAVARLREMREDPSSSSSPPSGSGPASPYLHAVRKVSELRSAPLGVLKAVEWQLKKDLYEVEKVRDARSRSCGEFGSDFLFFCRSSASSRTARAASGPTAAAAGHPPPPPPM